VAVRGYTGAVTNAIRYDAAGRRAALDQGLGGGGVSSTAYGYDGAGRLQTQSDDLAGASGDQSTTFGYNPASQLVSEARASGAYASTRAANAQRTYGVNGLNQYTGAGPAGAQSPFGYARTATSPTRPGRTAARRTTPTTPRTGWCARATAAAARCWRRSPTTPTAGCGR
jgi:hypothetical protein